MIKNYLLLALRNAIKKKSYTAINLLSVSLAIVTTFFIVQYLNYELGFDKFHERYQDIYRVVWDSRNPQTRIPHPMAQAMVNDFPEVESAVSITPLWGAGLTRQTLSFKNEVKDVQFDETEILAVDSTFFDVFSFPMVMGDAKTVLKRPDGLLISESSAKRYFGDENPMGKTLSVNDSRNTLEVIGVFKDVPKQAHFHFEFLISYVQQKIKDGPDDEFYSWEDFGHYNYIKLKPGTNAQLLESKLTPWVASYTRWSAEDVKYLHDNNYGFRLQNVADIHLNSHLKWELEPTGNMEYIYMLVAAAIIILLIASVNFINLSTAQASGRAREIGVRKTMGAIRGQLIKQFCGEAALTGAVSAILSLSIILAVAPVFSEIAGQNFSLTWVSFALVIGGGILIGVIAGTYPAFFLSAPPASAVLKNKTNKPGGLLLRKGFMIFQFSASLILVCVSFVIIKQLELIRNKPLGFEKEAILVLPVKNHDAIESHFLNLKQEISRIPGVLSITASSNIPGKSFNQQEIFDPMKPDHTVDASEMIVDFDFVNTLSISMAEGRNFSPDIPTDKGEAFLLNETAARNLQMGNALGKEIVLDRDGEKIKGKVIGVMKDFNYQSLHQTVQPLIAQFSEKNYNFILIKTQTEKFSGVIEQIKNSWQKVDNRFEFEFSFLADNLNKQYAEEQKIEFVLISFALISVFIACLGLLGIAALTFQMRVKEISVRKVMGASFVSIIVLLLKEFTTLIGIAIGIATPLAWFIVTNWLDNFALRIPVNPVIFIMAGATLVVIAWITIGYLTIRVAKSNPAVTLKQE